MPEEQGLEKMLFDQAALRALSAELKTGVPVQELKTRPDTYFGGERRPRDVQLFRERAGAWKKLSDEIDRGPLSADVLALALAMVKPKPIRQSHCVSAAIHQLVRTRLEPLARAWPWYTE